MNASDFDGELHEIRSQVLPFACPNMGKLISIGKHEGPACGVHNAFACLLRVDL